MENYLTEDLLEIFIKNNLTTNYIRSSILPNTRFKPDFVLAEQKLIIEFDGYQHYNSSSVCKRDFRKDLLYKEMGFELIRIPYFIQLDQEMVNFWFGKFNIKQGFNNYKHGFIDKKALLPADFCTLGIKRFKEELESIPSKVKEQIVESMDKKVKELQDKDLVYPLNF